MAVREPIGVAGTKSVGHSSYRGEARKWRIATRQIVLLALLFGYGALVLERNLAVPIVINPDGVSYAIIAEEYARGNVNNAVNGYWGPAISWLIAGPIALGASALASYRVLTVGLLFSCLYVVWQLTLDAEFRPELRYLTASVAGLMMLPWSLEVMTPDLLMLLVMLLVFRTFNQFDPELSRGRVAVLGVLGGVAFLVKPYGLLFFVVAFPLMLAYLSVRYPAARSARLLFDRYGVGMAAFLAVAVPWIVAMSLKYGTPTIGTSGRINLTLVAPETFREAHSRPVSSFNPPPFAGAVTGVEPLAPTTINWNPFASAGDLQHFVGNFMTNLMDLIRLYWPTMVVFATVVVLATAAIVATGSRVPEPSLRGVVFASVYVGLYCLVLVEVRYLWPAVMVFLVSALAMVNSWESPRRWLPVLVALPVSIMLIMGPYWRPGVGLGSENLDLLFEPQATRRLLGSQARDDAEALRPIAAGTRIASNGHMEKSSYLSYFLDASYFGATVDEPAGITHARLEEFDIQIFLCWDDQGEATPDYLQGYTLIETMEGGTLRVYERDAQGETTTDPARVLTPEPPL